MVEWSLGGVLRRGVFQKSLVACAERRERLGKQAEAGCYIPYSRGQKGRNTVRGLFLLRIMRVRGEWELWACIVRDCLVLTSHATINLHIFDRDNSNRAEIAREFRVPYERL